MKKSGSQIVWETLVRENIKVVFGYPGGAVIPLYDALTDYPIHHVLTRHEQGAAHMADGFARASGKVGVAVATSGPGATNLVTGIATAMMDSSPTVFITGQVGSKLIGYDAFQETDVTGVTLPITKHNYLVSRIEDISSTLREAFYIARTGRPGPVLVDVTRDAQTSTMDWEYDDSPIQLRGYRPDYTPLSEDLAKAAEMINAAKSPVILAGQGIIQSGALAELKEFAEATNTPVALTLLGLGGFPASHPLNLGFMGMHGEAYVNHAIQNADLLIALGMRFDDRVTGKLASYAQKARKIHIDIDKSEVNKNVKADLPLIGDLKETLQQLNAIVHRGNSHAEWLAQIEEWKGETASRDVRHHPENGILRVPHVIEKIWKATEGKAIIVTDVGQHQMWTAQYYRHEYPRHLITSGGLGTMGFGLPAAIGAKFAQPDAEVWVIVGDGGFQMTQAELSTCVQEGIKVNIAIMNNGYLGMVRQWQELFHEKNYSSTPIHSPDFVKIADAHGLPGVCVSDKEDVEPAIQRARETNSTVVLEFKVVGEDNVYPMVPAGADLHNMIRRPIPESFSGTYEIQE